MTICIVHRDRKGAMKRIEPEFDEISKTGVQFQAHNVNALTAEGIESVLAALQTSLGENGRVRMLMHSIAYGNLKLLVAQDGAAKSAHARLVEDLSQALGVSRAKLQTVIDEQFENGGYQLAKVTSPPAYSDAELLHDEDFSLTVHSMGTSLASWVQEVFDSGMFADDARILGMTSEGNEIAWRGYAAVSAAKVALEAVMRSIAVEYAPYGIRANIIQAGVTDTPALRLIPGSQHLKAAARLRNPFRRITTPEDVANFIFLMCRDEAAGVNGNIIRVDGGEHIGG